MMNEAMLEKYARLVVKTGINLKNGQILVILTQVECAFFARMVARVAFLEGAGDVVILWQDDQFSKVRFLHAPEAVFDKYPEWLADTYISLARQNAAFLSIRATDPTLMKEVDPVRMMREQKAKNTAVAEYRERQMSNRSIWSVVSVPTPSWARQVFPQLSEEQAVEKLWDAILTAVRVDTPDPVAAWESHKRHLKKTMDFLNGQKLQSIHFRNSLGTDLQIDLPEGHLWLGGADYTPEGWEFVANMPTEEVYTMPRKTGVNGVVHSSKPLNYDGNLVENFRLSFKDGRVVDFHAEKGYETLKRIISTDEGAAYLGEVALVPYDSPISRSGILFLNSLFDENAACHLALGKAYPVNLKNSEQMSKEELSRRGVNDSLVHVDFMIGTEDLEITGITGDGEEVKIFKRGNYIF